MGIRINAVCPGVIQTAMADELITRNPALEQMFTKDIPAGRLGKPEEIADAVLWLCSPQAGYMNAKGWLTPEEVHEYLRRITGREIDRSTTLLPPFYVDYGKNIRIGKGCWIQQGCTFFDRGGITIGDGVFIAPKVNLITINHDPNPDNRSATYGRPIVIEDKVRIGYGSIVGANSVVTHDVPPMTVVGGNPAKFIKKIGAGSRNDVK